MAADDPKSIGDSRGPYNKLRPTCFAGLFSFFAFGRSTLFFHGQYKHGGVCSG